MILHWFFQLIGLLGSLIVGLMPVWSVPIWVASTATTMTGWLANLGAIGYFVPLGPIAAVMALMFAAFTTGLAIRIGRIAYSMFTGGGGAA